MTISHKLVVLILILFIVTFGVKAQNLDSL